MGEESVHPLSVRPGCGAALPPPVGTQAPDPPDRGHGAVLAANSVAVFLAKHAEVLLTVSPEQKNQHMDLLSSSCPSQVKLGKPVSETAQPYGHFQAQVL